MENKLKKEISFIEELTNLRNEYLSKPDEKSKKVIEGIKEKMREAAKVGEERISVQIGSDSLPIETLSFVIRYLQSEYFWCSEEFGEGANFLVIRW